MTGKTVLRPWRKHGKPWTSHQCDVQCLKNALPRAMPRVSSYMPHFWLLFRCTVWQDSDFLFALDEALGCRVLKTFLEVFT